MTAGTLMPSKGSGVDDRESCFESRGRGGGGGGFRFTEAFLQTLGKNAASYSLAVATLA